MKRNALKWTAFGLLAVVTILLIAATIVEKICGASVATTYIYTSPAMLALWAATALSAMTLLLKRASLRRAATLLLHLSFAVILAGAMITHALGKQGRVHLRVGDAPLCQYEIGEGTADMPFSISLIAFELKSYTGSLAPMDYVSHVLIDGEIPGEVSMNNVLTHRGFRFYQSSYDSDGNGTILSVAYDPYGIAVTYTGYAMLLISIVAFFFQKSSHFRALLRNFKAYRAAAAAIALISAADAMAADSLPSTLPKTAADELCGIHVYYNDRICPLQTLARDVTIKLCGKDTYRGLTSEQVLSGWLFYYNDWRREPIIKIKSAYVRQILGISGNRASLADFVSIDGYKIDNALQTETSPSRRRALAEAKEKFNIASMVSTGALLKIYPYDDGKSVTWFSLADRPPADMPNDQWIFIRRSMDYVAEQVAKRDFDKVEELIGKIGKYQAKTAARVLPSPSRFKAETLYNSTNLDRPLAMSCVTIGVLLFILYCAAIALNKSWPALNKSLWALMLAVLLYISFRIALRGYVSGHIPMSNGFETMQLMAWIVALAAILASRRLPMTLPFSYLLAGLAMLVAMLGESNPQITHLMPVLQSPLLSVHVAVIMAAYSLLAFAMMNGLTGIVLHLTKKEACGEAVEHLHNLSQIIIYPAVMLLAIGIFTGAVWANISWGRYWGWDPKEVWALITMLIYSLALHSSLFRKMRDALFFHIFSVIAFLSVIITYFGVNFFLGGLHSYA